MKRSFDHMEEKDESDVVVISAGYISDESSSPEPTGAALGGGSNNTMNINIHCLTPPPTCSSITKRSFAHQPKFQPGNFVNHIPSVRMGPPYPGIRSQVPPCPGIRFQVPLHPRFQPAARPFPTATIAFRNRLFAPGCGVSPSLIPTINLDDESSSSSSTPNSSDGEDETDNGSTPSVHNEENLPTVVIKTEFRGESKAAMSSGQSRVLAPIVIEDSDDSLPNSPKSTTKKAKISLEASVSKPILPAISTDISELMNLLPQSDTEDDMTELMQCGMSMLDPEKLMRTISSIPVKEKPKRLNQRGLYAHVKHGSLGKVMAFLNAGANPTAAVKGEDGRSALHIAASKGHLDILLLLVYKAGRKRIDFKDNGNRTPLFFAVEKKHMQIAQFLVKAGADFRVKNTESMNLLHVAARKGSIELLKWLIGLGISVNDQDNFGWTALMWAAETDDNHLIIRYLIKKGAFANLLDNEMNICLHWSAIAGSFECTRELVMGSTISDINTKNKFGETPLHVAAKGDHYHVTQYLLLNGADHTIKNKSKATALDVCPASSKTFHCIRIRNEVVDGEIKKSHYMYINDISCGKERIPVSCINQLDDQPFPNDFTYVIHPEESSHVSVKRGLSTVRPCKCTGSCIDCKCVKLSEKQKLWYTEDGKLDVSIFEEESPVLYECTPLCTCWSYCSNRLVQKGIQYPLQVFKTRDKGWGLRTLVPVPLGAFILSYVGEIITDEEAERRNEDTYLFNLDLKTSGDEPNCMDALKYGNCGRFINHSCDANMKAVKLFTSHRDISFPEIAFFACKEIDAKEELCFNYGDSFWDVKLEYGMYCKCNSEMCQYGSRDVTKPIHGLVSELKPVRFRGAKHTKHTCECSLSAT